jgi:8-oxo-dGTP diphosphatase
MKVAVAVITDLQQRILITRRSQQASHGAMLWEFPGGKLEPNESPEAALVREIKEELDLFVLNYHFLGEVNHCYSQHAVSLHVYHVSGYEGEARCCEVQTDMRWVKFKQLEQFEFPAANLQIIELMRKYGLG